MLPLYMFFLALPIMATIGGGIEEAGWRYILQPELNKKYGFILSSIIVTPIWALWHLPLFFIPGVGQYGTSFWMFTLSLLGTTFAVGAISRISKNVFLCLLFHGIGNAGFYVFDVRNCYGIKFTRLPKDFCCQTVWQNRRNARAFQDFSVPYGGKKTR